MRSFFKLLWVRLGVSWWNFKESCQVIFYYYSNRFFAQTDLYLLRSYLTSNPYRMSKAFLLKKGETDLDTYGETPLTTMDVIAQECQLQSEDVFFELGCGRGRACYWVSAFIGCQVYGVEYLPAFVKIAQSVKRHYQIESIKFLYQDMLEVDLSEATVIYFYGTCSEDKLIEKLCKKLAVLAPSTKIITISFPLTDYHSGFKVVKRFPVKFPWGETDAFLQKPISP